MKLLQRAKTWLQKPIGTRAKTAGIGRVTPRYSASDTTASGMFLFSDYHYISHPVEGQRGNQRGIGTLEVDYQLTAFDRKALPHVTLKRMMNLLKNNSPAINQSANNFKQFLNYGYTLEGTPRAVANIEKILEMLRRRRKPFDLLIEQMADGIFFGGGLYREIVLARNREDTIDYVINDPTTVKFELVKDPLYGEDFHLIYLQKDGRVVSLEADPTVQYLPLNADVNSPFGKPYMLSAIFPAVWQLLILKDVRDVLRTQVSPFVHVKIDTEKILQITGGNTQEATQLAKQYRDAAIDQWRNKGPDTAVGSGDEVTYEIISGMNRMQMGMLDPIIYMLKNDIASGTNTMPLFLGHHASTTETNADVQWLIQTGFMRSILKKVGTALTDDLNMMNQAKGIGGEVVLTLLEMNALERLREAQIFQAEEESLLKLIDHLSRAYAEGTIPEEEMINTYTQRRDQIYQHTLGN